MATTNKAKANGAIKIIWEGVKLATNSFAHLYPILLLSFLFSSLIFLVNYVFLTPILNDLSMKSIIISHTDPNSPDFPNLISSMFKDMKEISLIEIVEIAVSFLINSLITTVAVFILINLCYNKKPPNKLNWSTIKRALITQLYIGLLQLGCAILLIASLSVLSFIYTYYSSSKVIISVVGIFLVLMATYFYLYVFAIFLMSIIVSVADDEESYGISAIDKAHRLISGRRNQAVLVVFLEFAATMIVMGPYTVATKYAKLNPLVVGIFQAAIASVFTLLELSVHTVYYYECKKSVEEIPTDGGFMYEVVPSHVDETLP